MSSGVDALALRKQALVARGIVQRRRIHALGKRIGDGMRIPRAAGAMLASPYGRRVGLGLALMIFKRGRAGRLLRYGLVAVALATLARRLFATNAR